MKFEFGSVEFTAAIVKLYGRFEMVFWPKHTGIVVVRTYSSMAGKNMCKNFCEILVGC